MRAPLQPPVAVVEIDPQVRDLTQRLLQDAGYQVVAAPDSEEAVALLRAPDNNQARIVVLGVDQGMAAAARDIVNLFAADGRRTVLLMAPVALHDSLHRALELAPGSVIRKPPVHEELVRAVERTAAALGLSAGVHAARTVPGVHSANGSQDGSGSTRGPR